MWELAKTPSHGGNSVRRIFIFALTAVIAAFLWVAFSGNLTHAADDQASWDGTNLSYESNQYTDAGQAQTGNSAGIPANSEYYTFTEPTNSASGTPETDIIYFATGKTPTTETSATFATYDTNTSHAPPTYSNPHDKKTITVQADNGTDGGTSCAISGIGWIVCPVSNTLATGMDWIMGVLANFVQVQPLNVSDTHNDLYTAWNLIRSIANVAFIIVFLIIIYSQLTSAGISNYGLKKLLPRLIVAAVLVNLSYYLCAVIVDVSNVLGVSLQGLLESMRSTVFDATGSNASVNNGDWENITTSALAGGSVAAGTVIGGIALNTTLIGGSLGGLWYLIVPALIGLLLAVLVVVLILAARQALIIILIVISPLAFVAYLLPNTEKLFGQWRKMFTTMMVFFPAFSIVFGGSQLASAIIIKNAQSMTVVVLGMIVQVAPLAITPWLLRLSGSTIQSVAKFAQGFNKRINGAVGGWSKSRREMYRLKGLSTPSKNPFRKQAQFWYSRGQRVKDLTGAYTTGAENMHHSSRRFAKTDTLRRGFEQQKGILEKQHDIHWKNQQLTTNSTAMQQDIRLRALTDQDTLVGQKLEARFEEVRATGAYRMENGNYHLIKYDAAFADLKVQTTHRDIALQGMRIQQAKNMQQRYLFEALNAADMPTATLQQQQLLDIAAGVDPNGRGRAQATAAAALAKISTEAVENTTKLLGARASERGETMKQYTQTIADSAVNGTATRDGFDSNSIEAAYEAIAQDGGVSILEAARLSENVDQSMLSRVLARNATTMKTKGGFHLQEDPSLAYNENDGRTPVERKQAMDAARAATLSNVTGEHIKDAKFGWYTATADNIDEILDALVTLNPYSASVMSAIYEASHLALNDDSTYSGITDRINQVRAIEAAVAARLGRPITPPRP